MQFDEALLVIKAQRWYKNNLKLQNYLDSEWLNCTEVSDMKMYKTRCCSQPTYIYVHSLPLFTYVTRCGKTRQVPYNIKMKWRPVKLKLL